VIAIAESRQERKGLILKSYPNIILYNEANDLIKDPKIDAVVIATPVFTHFELAKKALSSGKHVLLEKPMTSNSTEAKELISLSKRLNLTLMVDHTFLYTGAVNTMKNVILYGEIGKPQYFDSTRINLGLFQSDVNVLWDLAPHDISILKYLISEKPVSVNATGISHTSNGIENIAYMTINYQSNFIAHFNCSWASPVKVRSTLIGGDKKMLIYNDLEPSEKIRIYDTGFTCKSDEEKNKILVDYRVGDIYIPKLENKEALLGVANDFLGSIVQNKEPIASSVLGLEVVEILESAQKSIKLNGQEIEI
jgi:predicted dehydrogenase